MAYVDIYAAALDAAYFQPRCIVAMWKVAQDIMNEDPNTPNHEKRLAWAVNVMRDQVVITPKQLAMQVLRNPTISANPNGASDGDIQFQVNTIIDDLIIIG